MATTGPTPPPLVSIVLPIRNEATNLDRALDALDTQSYPRERIQIIAVDGGSTDGTVELVRRRMASDPRLSLEGGIGINTPMAMRVGLEAALGDVVIKVDGHGWVNDRFVEVAAAALVADPKLGCIGGLIEPESTTPTERAIAIARFSRLGVGGGVYTLPDRVQETDTVQCGAYRRRALEEVGGFDPDMAYGEDEEVNHRIRQAGWRIVMDPRMRFRYRVRPDLAALFRQYFRYGRARVGVVRKHPGFFKLKHAAPSILVLALGATLLAAPFRGWQLGTVAVWGAYLAYLAAGSAYLSIRNSFPRVDLVAASLAALHLGYGLGALRGVLDRRPPSARGSTQGIEGPAGAGSQRDGMAGQAQGE